MSSTTGAAEAVDAAVVTLLASDLTSADDDALLATVREVERARRRLAAVDHRLVLELERRSVAATRIHRCTAALLVELLHLDPGEARARVRAAEELGPSASLQGEPRPPLLPATAAAQADGAISARHAEVVSRAMGSLPAGLEPQVRAAAERTLAEQARGLRPSELTRAAERLCAHLDPDGSLTADADRARRRNFEVGVQGADGLSPVRGLLDPQCRALLDAAMSALARPEPDGALRDLRTPGQRRHDALAGVCRQALASGGLPSQRGLPATLVLTMTIDQLEAAIGGRGDGSTTGVADAAAPNPDGAWVRTGCGSRLPVPDALRLATDAHWVLALFDRGGQPLFLSRRARLASPAQRLALIARDRGCTRPGCDVPATWCEVHHLTEWAAGGATDVHNLALVCPFDHRRALEQGYTVRRGVSGRVEWTAPAFLDPGRVPRVNPLHHPPDLTDADPPVAA